MAPARSSTPHVAGVLLEDAADVAAGVIVLLGTLAAVLALWRFRSNRQANVCADALMIVHCSACQRKLKIPWPARKCAARAARLCQRRRQQRDGIPNGEDPFREVRACDFALTCLERIGRR
jgi:hypothetical protein